MADTILRCVVIMRRREVRTTMKQIFFALVAITIIAGTNGCANRKLGKRGCGPGCDGGCNECGLDASACGDLMDVHGKALKAWGMEGGGCGPNCGPDCGCGLKRGPGIGQARNFYGPAGPPTAAITYPYYTTRGPRDFLLDSPRSIGP